MGCAETIFILQLKAEPVEAKPLKAEDVIEPFVSWDDIRFKTYLINLKADKDRGVNLTPAERYLLTYKKDFGAT